MKNRSKEILFLTSLLAVSTLVLWVIVSIVVNLFTSEFFSTHTYTHNETRKRNEMQSIRTKQSILDFFYQNDLNQATYPYYFGGMYIDNNGNLVLLIAEPSIFDVDENFLLFAEKEGVSTRHVKFSYNELKAQSDVLRRLSNVEPSRSIINEIVNTWYIDIINNRVAVELTNLNQRQITRFKNNVIDSPMITFRESSGTFRNLSLNFLAAIIRAN
ncbi:MAG: hypothetical protein FWC91_10820 [Defluviitaleaceae bacterium]|nr:hypothetical protein [Defluviitaleaceae bacterium]